MSYSKAFLYSEAAVVATGSTAAMLPAGTSVTVKNPDNSAATLYTDENALTTTSNIVAIDANNTLSFYAKPGYYKLSVGAGPQVTVAVGINPAEAGGVHPTPAFRTNSPRSFLPGDLKLVGGNLVPPAAWNNSGTHVPNFDLFYAAWSGLTSTPWTEANGMKVQVDRAVALGLNCVRLIGDVKCILNGSVTRAQYLASWTQLINYCDSVGLYVYPCGYHTAPGGTYTWAQIAAELAALAAHVAQYRNVVAFDCINEWATVGFPNPDTASTQQAALTNLQAATVVSNAVRAAAPTLPITFSVANITQIWGGTTDDRFNALVDYWDGHIYMAPGSLNATFDAWDTYWTNANATPGKAKPFILGEFGVPVEGGLINGTAGVNWTTAQRQDCYANVRDFIHLQPHCMGSLAWALADQDTANNNKWGLFDASSVERTDVTSVLKTFPQSKRAPMKIVLAPTVDTTFAANNFSNNIVVGNFDIVTGFALGFRFRVYAGIDVVTAGNDYDAVGTISSAASPYIGVETAPVRARTGTVVGRYSIHEEWDGILPPGYAQIALNFGHPTGSAATGVLRAAETRGVLELYPF